MIQHLFKLIWKKRKSNFLIMLEIFVAFFILFAVSSLSVYFYWGYIKPSGINTDNVWVAYVDFNSNNDSLNRINRDLLKQKVKNFKEIKSFSFGSHFPYGNSNSTRGFDFNGKVLQSEVMSAEETYPSVLGLKMQAGEWFKDADTLQRTRPIVITQHLKEEMFGNEDAIGKVRVNDDNATKEKVVGVIPNFKFQNDYQSNDNCILQPMDFTSGYLVLKTDPSVSADFEAHFAKSLQQLGKIWTVQINHMEDMKKEKNHNVITPLIIAFIVCGFLIINVAFGLFGVLFQNINRRKGEIGVRRAMGATGRDIQGQFVGEMVVLATFSIALGLFFAVQFPLLNVFDVAASIYMWGMLLAVAAVYAIVVSCAWFPSRQAAAIHPAMALHDE